MASGGKVVEIRTYTDEDKPIESIIAGEVEKWRSCEIYASRKRKKKRIERKKENETRNDRRKGTYEKG